MRSKLLGNLLGKFLFIYTVVDRDVGSERETGREHNRIEQN